MRAIQFDQYGAPDELYLAEVDTPNAGPGQIQARVAAIGVNPADFKWRQGITGRALLILCWPDLF
jgi:NADPH2:quinone reductase